MRRSRWIGGSILGICFLAVAVLKMLFGSGWLV